MLLPFYTEITTARRFLFLFKHLHQRIKEEQITDRFSSSMKKENDKNID